jgi:hypothetical protein
MGYHDRLTFPDFTSKFCELLTFQPEGVELIKVSTPTRKLIKGGLVLEGIVDNKRNTFTEAVEDPITHLLVGDYLIQPDRRSIKWLNTEIEVIGSKLSFLYTTSPSYIISDVTHELRGTYTEFKHKELTFVELPKQYMVRREEFIYNGVNSV